jgi:hypothetical protein
MMNARKIYLAKPQTKRALEAPRPELEVNIRINTDVMYLCGLASAGSRYDSMVEFFFKDDDETLTSKEVVNFLTITKIINTHHRRI